MNFTKFYYERIAERIIRYRKSKGVNKLIFCTIICELQLDTSALSRIEKAKVVKEKNPYFLSPVQIEVLSTKMEILPSELIWGKEYEREHFIKMILITILMNNKEANPFEKGDLNDWIQNEISFDPQWEKNKRNELSQNALEQYYLEKYGFFINHKNHEQYLSLASETDSRYEKISNIILKILLLLDYDFTRHFIAHLTTFTKNDILIIPQSGDSIPEAIQQINSEVTLRTQNLIEDFIINKGQYSKIILDGHAACYHEFISAFDKLWHTVKKDYLDFFNQNIFSMIKDSTGAENTLKLLQNKNIEEVLLSDCFLELNEKILRRINYYDTFSMLLDIKTKIMLNHALQDSYFIKNLDRKNAENTSNYATYKKIHDLNEKLTELIESIYIKADY